jgi:hypothetical protein
LFKSSTTSFIFRLSSPLFVEAVVFRMPISLLNLSNAFSLVPTVILPKPLTKLNSGVDSASIIGAILERASLSFSCNDNLYS